MARNRAIEQRFLPVERFEIREADGGAPELDGYASVFNQEAVIADWFTEWREVFSPGAFKKTLKEGDIRALWNHDPNIVLGRNKAGTLELAEDEHGLRTVIRPPDSEWGRPVVEAVKRGDVSGMSITFQVVKESIEWPKRGSGELAKRTIKEAKLFDVSPVTFPAFEMTSIQARSVAELAAAGGGGDLLLQAAQLARMAELGRDLTAEERETISSAVEILENVSREPSDHSLAVQGAEPVIDHSAAARARRLQIMRAKF